VRPRSRMEARAIAAAFFAALAAVVLLRFPPEQYEFYPVCPVYRYLHVLCPGCGATRALSALLRGQVAAALRLNWLAVLMVPLCVGYVAMGYRRWTSGDESGWPRIPSAAIYGALAVAIVFGVARNL
jgi:Protein of unknown function (DUF2752)